MPYRQFRAIVTTVTQTSDPATWAILTGPIRTLTAAMLADVRAEIAKQITDRSAHVRTLAARAPGSAQATVEWQQEQTAFDEWMPKAASFSHRMEAVIRDFEADTAMTLRQILAADQHLAAVAALARAIAGHRAAAESAGWDAEEHDTVLWDVLSTVTIEAEPGVIVPVTDWEVLQQAS